MDARILIVDSSDACRKLEAYLLGSVGLKTRSAYDARSAWRAIEARAPALVILDLVLPDTDGLVFARNVTERGIRAIAVTGCVMLGDRGRALGAGCAAYVPKPIDTRTFANVVLRELG